VSRRTLNLGILAHVDAGKTTLTERLLYAAGVIDQLGSVDAGTTQTDSLALERQRGITIRSAVASFPIADVTVNLIDTPGHPDFIAEVERVLYVLDGAVVVISAIEGVQPQTRILMRTLRRLRIPVLLFVNKIDRPGAGEERVLQAICGRLKVAAVPMGRVRDIGSSHASFAPSGPGDAAFRAKLTEVLADRDERLLAALVRDEAGVPYQRLREQLAVQTERALVQPVFFGSAITGAGIESLLAGLTQLLPTAPSDAEGPVSGRIFKIERGPHGEKIAYVRMFSSTARVRDRLRLSNGVEDKVTGIAVYERGPAMPSACVSAGEIGKLWGLQHARIGDLVGQSGTGDACHEFPPPMLESVVVPRDPADRARLRVALGQLAEQDPLINMKQDDERREISVSLYGEVQKEVIQATLHDDFQVEVSFRETTMIYIERPAGTGSAVEFLQSDSHPFTATIGLKVEPAPVAAGIEFRLHVDPRQVPIYIYKTTANFIDAMTQYVRHTLEQGLRGWQVADCVVTMTECNYYVGDGPGKQKLPTPRTTAADFRKLTPLVLMDALGQAGTLVCEPMTRVHVEVPAARMGGMLSALAQLGAAVDTPFVDGDLSVVEAVLPAASVRLLQQQLPGLTGGEGTLQSSFGGYQPVRGSAPSRPSLDKAETSTLASARRRSARAARPERS
jgi:ribosomal protection tetracycline resistance protein